MFGVGRRGFACGPVHKHCLELCGKNGQGATKGGEVRMTLNVSASAWFLKVFHNAYA